jgi:ElaB/YqjD/DUF883 family membrane-anchored ribosome-binding protein
MDLTPQIKQILLDTIQVSILRGQHLLNKESFETAALAIADLLKGQLDPLEEANEILTNKLRTATSEAQKIQSRAEKHLAEVDIHKAAAFQEGYAACQPKVEAALAAAQALDQALDFIEQTDTRMVNDDLCVGPCGILARNARNKFAMWKEEKNG